MAKSCAPVAMKGDDVGISAIWGILKSIPAAIALIGQLVGLVNQIRRAMQTDPVDQYKKAQDAQKEADKTAEEKDDTGGVFGGGK